MYDAAIFIFLGAIEIIFGVPLFLKKVPPNRIYGYRCSRIGNNKDLWFAVNKLAGKYLILSGICLIVISVLLMIFFKNSNEELLRIVNTAAVIIPLAAAIIRCEKFLKENSIK